MVFGDTLKQMSKDKSLRSSCFRNELSVGGWGEEKNKNMETKVEPIPASREQQAKVEFYKIVENFSTTYFRKQILHDETKITSFTVANLPITADEQDAEYEDMMKSIQNAEEITVDEICSVGLNFLTK